MRRIMLLAALLLGPTAAATQGHGRVFSDGETLFSGVQSVSGDALGVEWFGLGDEVAARFEGQGTMSISTIRFETFRLALPGRQPFDVHMTPVEEQGAPTEMHGSLALSGIPGQTALIRVLPVGDAIAFTGASRTLSASPVGSYWDTNSDGPWGYAGTIAGTTPHPVGKAAALDLEPSNTAFSGNLVLLATGVTVTHAGETTSLSRQTSADSIQDPATGSGRTVSEISVLVVRAEQLRIVGGTPATLAASRLEARVNGRIAWSGVDAAADLEGQEMRVEAGLLELDGVLTVNGDLRQESAQWTFNGEVRQVLIDTQEWRTAVTSGGAALAGLAVLLVLVKFGKGLVTFLVGRHTPRLVKADPFASATRRKILDIIHAGQPVTLKAIRATAGISATAATYHLRILKSHDIVQSAKPAGHSKRNTTFMLNSGSLHARVPVAGAEDRIVSLEVALSSANSHPIRSAVFEFLGSKSPATYDEISAHLVQLGHASLPRSTVSRHLTALEESGALVSTWVARRKEYRLAISANEAKVIQYRSFLIAQGMLPVFQAVARGTLRSEPDLERLWNSREEVRSARHRLSSLRRLGIVQQTPAGFTVASWLSPAAIDVAGGAT